MTDEQAARWARERQRGLLRYVILRGVLAWGVLTAVLAAGLTQLLGSDRSFTEQLGGNLIGFPIMGIFVGAMWWWLAERQYRRWQAGRNPHAS